jgi:hypothetical protein
MWQNVGALARPEAEAAMTESDGRDTEVLGGRPATVQTRVPVVSPVEKPKRKGGVDRVIKPQMKQPSP